MDKSIGCIFYEILEQLIRKDLHHLEELEDQIGFSAVVSFDGMVWNEFYGDE